LFGKPAVASSLNNLSPNKVDWAISNYIVNLG